MVRTSSINSCANDRQQTKPHEAIFLGVLRSTQECYVCPWKLDSLPTPSICLPPARHSGRKDGLARKSTLEVSIHPTLLETGISATPHWAVWDDIYLIPKAKILPFSSSVLLSSYYSLCLIRVFLSSRVGQPLAPP